MEKQINKLVEKTWSSSPMSFLPSPFRADLFAAEQYEELPASKRLIIGVAGIPGSGTKKCLRYDRIIRAKPA